jgi:hypothetical protein
MKLDAEVGTATSVSAVDSTIPVTGMYALRYWTTIPVASIAEMMDWSTILEMPEPLTKQKSQPSVSDKAEIRNPGTEQGL